MTDIQKILKAIANRLDEDGNIMTGERLRTIVDVLDGCPSYIQTAAVLAGFGVKEEEEDA